MTKHSKCPTCGRTKFRIIKGQCQSCYTIAFNRARFVRKRPKNIILTDLQKEFITGCLLGDAWISNLKYGRQSPCFGIDRKQDDLVYLRWQYNFVENLCSRPILMKDKLNKATKKTQKHCLFETRYLPSLLEFRKLWYPNDNKIVPNDLKLTKLTMQLWYCDDGSLEVFESGNYRLKFSTHGFSKDENVFLMDLLKNRYCEEFSLVKDGDKYTIRANTKAAIVLIRDLEDGFPPGIERKLP